MAKLWEDLRKHLERQALYGELIKANQLAVFAVVDSKGGPGSYMLGFAGELATPNSDFQLVRHRIRECANTFETGWLQGYDAANSKGHTDWILCTEQLPPYDELVWLTHAASHAWGKPVPEHEQCWRVERGQRHATNKHGEIWWRAGISGEMAWEVFSWTRSAQPALDARAGK